MKRWKLIEAGRGRSKRFFLDNEDQTEIILKRCPDFPIQALLDKMNELRVPLAYTKGLKEIRFSNIRLRLHGFYINDTITINIKRYSKFVAVTTLVHELGHHVNSGMGKWLEAGLSYEKIATGRLMRNSQVWDKNEEYVSLGFERFYEDAEERKQLRKNHPILYSKILRTHREFLKL